MAKLFRIIRCSSSRVSFYNNLSFNWLLLLMRKSYNYEVITFFSNGVKKYLGSRSGFKASGSGSGMRFLAGSGFNWIRIRNTVFLVSIVHLQERLVHADLMPCIGCFLINIVHVQERLVHADLKPCLGCSLINIVHVQERLVHADLKPGNILWSSQVCHAWKIV